MGWEKKGLIFCPDGSDALMNSHASIPFADPLDEEIIRIYFSSRNSEGKSFPFSIDVNSNDISKILKINQIPILQLGKLGTFDDSGIMPSCIVNYEGKKYMYYIAWNPQVNVSYRLSIGLAISIDNGESYTKYSDAPICDRDLNEPYFNTAPYVVIENGVWRMWYISCTEWLIINNYPEPKYHVKYCESDDGICWNKKGIVCIDYDADEEAIGRPCVLNDNGVYKMYYSYRKIGDYRSDNRKGYRLAYAESADGIRWKKFKNKEIFSFSNNESEWDYYMNEYCHVFFNKGTKTIIYNGNGFGKSGIGYAINES